MTLIQSIPYSVPCVDKDYNLYNITPQLELAMKIECLKIKAKEPNITAQQMAKKVVKHFKLKKISGYAKA